MYLDVCERDTSRYKQDTCKIHYDTTGYVSDRKSPPKTIGNSPSPAGAQGLVPWSLERGGPSYTPVHVIGWDRVDADTTETQHRDERHAHQPQGRPRTPITPSPVPKSNRLSNRLDPIPGSLSNLHGVSLSGRRRGRWLCVVLPGWQLNVNVNVNSSRSAA